jgi:outer membrane protein assembly factor BamB
MLTILLFGPLWLAVQASAAPTVRTSVATVEQATYHDNLERQGYTPGGIAITTSNASDLASSWRYSAHKTISDQVAVVDGIAYWGDWSGHEHATSSTGRNLWSTFVGGTKAPGCSPSTVGVGSSATVGTVNSKRVVITGGGAGNVVELDATTGKIIWDIRIAPKVGGFVWSSPALYNGSAYIGMSSLGDCPIVPSAVLMLNAATGAVEHRFSTVPRGCIGGGVWSSPTIDAAENALFISTGNASCTTSLQDAMLKLSLSRLGLESSWQVPANQRVSDSDWGSTPTLFSAKIDGKLVSLVGSADKNGIFYALDTVDLANGPVWEFQVAVAGDCPQCGQGSISPAAWDGTTLYVAGGTTQVGSTECKGSVSALDPATGEALWRDCEPGVVLGALTEVPGLLFVTAGADLEALATHNGAALFSAATPGGSPYDAPATVSGSRVWAGNTNGKLYTWSPPARA